MTAKFHVLSILLYINKKKKNPATAGFNDPRVGGSGGGVFLLLGEKKLPVYFDLTHRIAGINNHSNSYL